MLDSGSSWTELRYAATQALPDEDGLRDELDGIAFWSVDAVRCFHDRPQRVVAHGEVAVFDLESGLDLSSAAAAYGGAIRRAAELVLTPVGRLQPDLDLHDVDKLLLLLEVVIGPAGRGEGLGLAASLAIRERLGSRRSLVACFPEPRATDPVDPAFFADVPAQVQEQWWKRGLAYRADNLWLLPPVH